MKLNKKLKEISKKMHHLKIPRKERREYLERAFVFCFRLQSWLEYQTLNEELKKLEKEPVNPGDAVKRIDSAFDSLDRYSEENYHHGLNRPYFNHHGL